MFALLKVSSRGSGNTNVAFVFDDYKLPPQVSTKAAKDAVARPEFSAKPGQIVEAFGTRRIVLVGIGKRSNFSLDALRTACSALGRHFSKIDGARAEFFGIPSVEAAELIGETLGIIGWNFAEYRGSATDKRRLPSVSIIFADRELADAAQRGASLAASVNVSRFASMSPPNVATPMWMGEYASRIAKETGLACKIISGKELEKERMAGLINVGKASENAPCLIRLAWNTSSKEKPLVLVGKTVTYDTGGLSLKVNNGMVGMKYDKNGGCAVLGAMHAVATVLRPNRPVIGLLAAAENSVSDEAMRPDDVLTFRNGVTVEVTNTDAEGRLVLADALCWACDKENPAAIVDLATLTGGVVTALGSTYAGLFSDDAELLAQLQTASAASSERIWQLPLHQEYRDMLKSPIADIVNSNPNRKAHPIQGAAFLSYFVKKSIPWAHIDIAGVSSVDGDYGPFVKGPTGFGVRLLARWIEAQS